MGSPGRGRVHNPIEDAYDTRAPWSPGSKPAEPGSPSTFAKGRPGAEGAGGPVVRRGLW
ncbi:unnamed protein product [Laminaria digitata]